MTKQTTIVVIGALWVKGMQLAQNKIFNSI